MSYSLIKPLAKPIFSIFTKLWVAIIVATILMLLAANAVIKVQTLLSDKTNSQRQASYDELSVQISDIREQISLAILHRDAALDIYTANAALEQSLKNFFDIVPDTITLNEIYMEQSGLTIKGQTPSKNAFNLLLEAPLRSIFTSTQTTFYALPSGWLNFVSVNKTDSGDTSLELR